MKKIIVIHHSHTDIGYTERQEKLMTFHRDFILQAIDIIERDIAATGSSAFKWQCENFWQIEDFCEEAKPEDVQKLLQYVKSGNIGISGNYLNMTELVADNVLRFNLMKAPQFAASHGLTIRSSMSADINGYAWGYPDALKDAGIDHLFCALHSHHGMFPLYTKQKPFYWQGPKGNKVLTWIGEHYHLGNVMYLCPNAGSSYTLPDDVWEEVQAKDGFLGTTPEEVDQVEISYAVRRLRRYIAHFEEENYPFDVIPLMVSGASTDNAPPNGKIVERLANINRELQGIVHLEMGTLDDFFQEIENSGVEIPTYEGDFTDWWADGVGSTPNTVKLYKDAQRKLNTIEKLDPNGDEVDAEAMAQAQKDLALYAEHTWGYSSSINEPWDSLVTILEQKKGGYAISAHNALSKQLDRLLANRGEVSIRPYRDQLYRVINPHDTPYTGYAKLYLEYWDLIDDIPISSNGHIIVRDTATGAILPSNFRQTARAYEIEVEVNLEPHATLELRLEQDLQNTQTIHDEARVGAEGVHDIVVEGEPIVMPELIETEAFKITFTRGEGISEIIDKRLNQSILNPNDTQKPFSALYQHTKPGRLSQGEVRRRMGRNRSSFATDTYTSVLENVEIIENQGAMVQARLTYSLEGTNFYDVYLKIGKHLPILDARVCFHKTSVWNPENLYVALPFTLSDTEACYVDKTGCVMRPGLDQLPGSCQEFYLIQNSIVKHKNGTNLVIALKDSPLIAFGDHTQKPIRLCDGANEKLNRSTPWSWVMNNFWETNFKADLGGFYEFRYTIYSGLEGDVQHAIDRGAALNEGLLAFAI